MKNLYLDPNTYDLTLQNYNLRVTQNMSEFLSQKIENTLKTIAGEFFANETIGVPYFTDILGKKRDLATVTSIFRNQVLSISEVSEIIEFTTDYEPVTREFSIDYSVKAIDDTTVTGTTEV